MTNESDKANLEKTGNTANAGEASKSAEMTSTSKAPEATKAPEPAKKSVEEEERELAERTRLENEAALGKRHSPVDDGPDARNRRDGRDFERGVNEPAGRPAHNTAADLSTDEGRMANIDQVMHENEQRNERNREGHEKNMDKIAESAEQAQTASERAPPTGKQRDTNTPEVLPDGTKVWK